jgi:pyruvate,orthophosphate dikinase
MFFEGDRIDAMREMILAETLEERKAALGKLLPYQREDFAGIFRALNGYPATIRFLDPPLHEFLPNTKEQQGELAKKLGVSADRIHSRVEGLHEFNPMLGSGLPSSASAIPRSPPCRPAPCSRRPRSSRRKASRSGPEIMIPLVGFKKSSICSSRWCTRPHATCRRRRRSN